MWLNFGPDLKGVTASPEFIIYTFYYLELQIEKKITGVKSFPSKKTIMIPKIAFKILRVLHT